MIVTKLKGRSPLGQIVDDAGFGEGSIAARTKPDLLWSWWAASRLLLDLPEQAVIPKPSSGQNFRSREFLGGGLFGSNSLFFRGQLSRLLVGGVRYPLPTSPLCFLFLLLDF